MINIFIPPDELIGFVWNADDWQKLREEFRIIGALCGSLSKHPRQDIYYGLPMCLSPEEITLLKDKHIARLVWCPSLLERPNDQIRNNFAEEEITFHEAQRQSYLQKKELVVKRSLNNIIKGKQKDDGPASRINREKLISLEVDKIQSVTGGNYVNTLLGDPWINENEFINVDWKYPHSEEERLKYDIFKDLWERNYCVTSGSKFGGDFLCYVGDPAKFHASFIVVCKAADAVISCNDLIVAGRIGSYTKKTFVFASRLDACIVYESLQWVGKSKELYSLVEGPKEQASEG